VAILNGLDRLEFSGVSSRTNKSYNSRAFNGRRMQYLAPQANACATTPNRLQE